MKKYVLIALLGSIILAGCDNNEPAKITPDNASRTAYLANIEQLSFMGGAVDEFVFDWSDGNYIGVFGSAQGSNAKYVIDDQPMDGSEIFVYGPKVSGDDIIAYYPYDATVKGSIDMIPVTIPIQQTYFTLEELYRKFSQASTLVGRYDVQSDKIAFEYPMGCLIFEVKIDAKIKSFTLRSASKKLSGKATINRSLDLQMLSSGVDYVVFSSNGTPIETTADNPVKLYMILPPQIYPKGDLSATVIIEGEPGGEDEVFSYRMGEQLKVDRISTATSNIISLSLNADGIPEMDIVNGELNFYK